MFKDKFVQTIQWVFIGLLVTSIVLALKVYDQIEINTDLSELNPQQRHSKTTKDAINSLSEDIERRVLLLISGANEDTVYDAESKLRDELSKLNQLQLHPHTEDLAYDLIETIIPHRFSLLNATQRNSLNNSTNQEIIKESESNLYSISTIRLLPLNQDPTGWHSQFLQDLLFSMQDAPSNSDNFYSVVSFGIKQGATDMRQQKELLSILDTQFTDLTNEYNISINRSGIFFFAVDAANKSKADISLITTGSTIGVIALLLLVFRSIHSLILPVTSVVLGVGFAFLVSHALYGNVHILTIVFGATLIGIVIDYSLHYFYHIASSSHSNEPLYRALSLSLITSLIGYSSLTFSDLQALQKVAVFSCCGLLMAWLSVISIGKISSCKAIQLNQVLLPSLQSFLSSSVAHLKPIVWLFISVTLVACAFIVTQTAPSFNDDPRLFFKPSEELLASERTVAQNSNDYEPGRYLLIHGTDESNLYARTKLLFSSLEKQDNVDVNDLSSLLKWVPSKSQQDSDYLLQNRLYANKGIAQSLIKTIGADQSLWQSLNNEYQLSKGSYLEISEVANILSQSTPPLIVYSEDQITSFILIKKGVDTTIIEGIANSIDGIEYINSLEQTQYSLEQQRYSALILLGFAYCLIALLLGFRYRSMKAIGMLMVPITASSLVLLISVVGLGQTLNLFHVMALFLVLGFGMDYTIFTQEISDARAVTLQAILLSAMTSIISFGLLSISDIAVAYSFGFTLLIGNCFNLLGVFVYSHCLNNREII